MSRLEQLIKRLKEPSTIKGLILIAALLGVNINPEMQDKIIVAAGAVYGIIQVFISKD